MSAFVLVLLILAESEARNNEPLLTMLICASETAPFADRGVAAEGRDVVIVSETWDKVAAWALSVNKTLPTISKGSTKIKDKFLLTYLSIKHNFYYVKYHLITSL